MNFDAFISYANQDKAVADAACAKLEADGIRCWIAPRDVPPGAQWAAAIVDAIDHCCAMVLIFSSSANGSNQIHREVQRAFEREVPVVPFRIENVVPEQALAYYMGSVHWLDALTPPLEQHLQKLVASLKPYAHSKTFGERASEARGPQAAEADNSAETDRSRRPEPRQPWQPSRWSVLTAGVVGAVLIGAVGVWLGAEYWRPASSGPQLVQSPAPPVTPEAPPVQPPPAPAQAPTTPVQPASSSVGPLSLERERALKPKDIFKECDKCPEMIVVPAGSFTMGSSPYEEGRHKEESPQHQVTFANPFAVGKFDVTVEQFAAFVDETSYSPVPMLIGPLNPWGSECWDDEKWELGQGLSWRNPGFAQGRLYPVVCLNWSEAKAYLDWLAQKTGRAYRLLTEAEWEYSARARTEPGDYPRYSFGNDEKDLCRYGNVTDQSAKRMVNWPVAPCNDGYAYTSPVGSFIANAFDLYDMQGNVWQWTEDCYNNSYNGAPRDGSAWKSGDCSRHALRGGSWYAYPRDDRAAYRLVLPAVARGNNTGFRVARTLTP
jgi:formylglycine-generating enzyme required for sulfatase activity